MINPVHFEISIFGQTYLVLLVGLEWGVLGSTGRAHQAIRRQITDRVLLRGSGSPESPLAQQWHLVRSGLRDGHPVAARH
ncbi:hypothetical protein [Actinomadura nitritigenes]|uniref:hypothetical protein n=1 Tax=Actinomadura nitritigenes TaxID=134602 RepID=UPI003D94717E